MRKKVHTFTIAPFAGQAIILNMGRKIINDIVLHLYVGIMEDSVTPEVQEST